MKSRLRSWKDWIQTNLVLCRLTRGNYPTKSGLYFSYLLIFKINMLLFQFSIHSNVKKSIFSGSKFLDTSPIMTLSEICQQSVKIFIDWLKIRNWSKRSFSKEEKARYLWITKDWKIWRNSQHWTSDVTKILSLSSIRFWNFAQN